MGDPIPVVCWTRYVRKREQYTMVLEVGPVADPAERIALLRAIQSAGFDFRKGGLREEAKFTRIVSVKQKPKRTEDGDPDLSDEAVKEAVGALWTKLWKEGGKIVQVLKEFGWN